MIKIDKRRMTPNTPWTEMTQAGSIFEAGNSEDFKTGDWRSITPKIDESACIHCLICWMTCPDMSILLQDGKMNGFDYDHCKGCGLCAKECPKQCITME